MVEEPCADARERKHEVQAEQVPLDEHFAPVRHPGAPYTAHLHLCPTSEEMERDAEAHWPRQVEQVVQDDRQCNHERLANF